MKTYTGEIRLIRWGMASTNQNFQYSVPQVVTTPSGVLKIVQIVREVLEFGGFEYHIECVRRTSKPSDTEESWGQPFIWKTYIKAPDELEYFINDEAHDYIKI